eukprot:2155427-Pyramimonas_sp.AAC.1
MVLVAAGLRDGCLPGGTVAHGQNLIGARANLPMPRARTRALQRERMVWSNRNRPPRGQCAR